MKNLNEAFERQFNNIELEKLLEAMSPEDKHDTELIRSVQRKIAKRSNAALTPEEQAVLTKYNIVRHKNSLAVRSEIDPSGWYTRSEIKFPEEESPKHGTTYWKRTNNPDEVNLADIARKRGARLDRDVLMKDKYGNARVVVGPARRGAKKDGRTYFHGNREDAERDALGAVMQNDVLNMSQALKDRKYHQKEVDTIDANRDERARQIEAEYQKKLADNESSREWEKNYHSKKLDDAKSTIDGLLHRKEESFSADNKDYFESSEYRCNRYCEDITEQLSDIQRLLEEKKLDSAKCESLGDVLMRIYDELESFGY